MRVRLTSLGQGARDDVIAFRRKELTKVANALALNQVTAADMVRVADAMERGDPGEPESAG